MPQTAPISWLTLMILFSIILIITSILNYTFMLEVGKSSTSIKINSSKSWKW